MFRLLDEASRAEIEARVAASSSLVVYAGFDGTLAPIVSDPNLARLPAETLSVLEDLSTRDGVLVAILSGRSLPDLSVRVAIPSVVYCGDHGLTIEGATLRFEHPEAGRRRQALNDLNQRITALPLLLPGIHVEAKNFCTTIHFRHADGPSREHLRTIVRSLIPDDHPELYATDGKENYEIRPRVDWCKGDAIRWIHERIKATNLLPIVIGDDPTDEDAYTALEGTISIRVGDGPGGDRPTSARFHLDDPASVGELLRWLLALWTRRQGAPDRDQPSGGRRTRPGLEFKESSPILNVRVRRSLVTRKRLSSEGGSASAMRPRPDSVGP
jgi:trehalose-phosphatase